MHSNTNQYKQYPCRTNYLWIIHDGGHVSVSDAISRQFKTLVRDNISYDQADYI